jgi:AraC family transcriptional regulator
MQRCKDITLGERLRRIEGPGLSICEVSYAPGTTMQAHAHENSNVSLVIQGSFEERIGDTLYRLGPGSVVVKPGGTIHANRYGPTGARAMVIEFLTGGGMPAWAEEEIAGRCRWIQSGPCVASAVRTYCQAFAPEGAGSDPWTGVIDILATAQAEASVLDHQANRMVRVARELLHAHFAESIETRQIAAELEVHPVYLARAFRRHLGCSLTEYRRRLQLSMAARLLAASREPLAWIALRCGFSDQSHMTRAFRAYFGLTPGRYRRVAS